MSLLTYHRIFDTNTAYFLTFKGNPDKKVQQKLDFVSKLCKKITNTYIIVRERNKKTEGYHFHALLKLTSRPKDTWFIKGTHMNLQKVGRTTRNPKPFTAKDFHEFPKEAVPVMSQTNEESIVYRLQNISIRRDPHIERVLNYMQKEFELPIQYVDYVIIVASKSQPLRDKWED